MKRGAGEGHFKASGDRRKSSIEGPKWGAGKHSRGEKMDIHIAQAHSHEFMSFDESEDLFVVRHLHLLKGVEKRDNLGPALDLPTGEFSDHEGVTKHRVPFEQGGKFCVPIPQVVNPNRGVDENRHITNDGEG